MVSYNNPEMCELTERVIFTEPYTIAANNRHNSPHLDADVAALKVGGAGGRRQPGLVVVVRAWRWR